MDLSLLFFIFLYSLGFRMQAEAATYKGHRVVSIHVTEAFTSYMLLDDKSLYMWGDNYYGQIGIKSKDAFILTPSYVMKDVKRFYCPDDWVCAAIDSKGNAYAWGRIGYGLYDRAYMNHPVFMTGNVKDIIFGQIHQGFLNNKGELRTIGQNHYGQLGNGNCEDTLESFSIPLKNVKSASFGRYHSAALKEDGSLWVWGNNISRRCGLEKGDKISTPVKLLDGVKTYYIDYDMGDSYAIRSDGSLWAWGVYSGTAKKMIGSGIVSASFSGNNHAAVSESGNLYVWGKNESGQLGTGNSSEVTSVKKIASNVKTATMTETNLFILKKDGSLYSCGSNECGTVGNGGTANVKTPVKVLSSVSSIIAGSSRILALTKAGTLYAWGSVKTKKAADDTVIYTRKPVKVMNGVKSAYMDYTTLVVTKLDDDICVLDENTFDLIKIPGATQTKELSLNGYPKKTSAANVPMGIKVSWKRNPAVTGYLVYRQKAGGSRKKIATIRDNLTTSFVDKKIRQKNGQRYIYRVKGYKGKNKNINMGKDVRMVRLTASSIRSLKTVKKGKLKVAWKQNKKAAGYQIQYALDQKMISGKKTKTLRKKTGQKTLKLKKRKTYYVRVRGYAKWAGKRYYSAWSGKKKKKTR